MKQRSPLFRRLFAIFFFGLICFIQIASLRAQDYVTGAFLGQVTDSADVPIAGATVRVVNNDTGVPLARQTDASGHFRMNLLPPGDYTITISKQGYATQTVQRALTTLKTTDVIPPVKLKLEVAVAAATPTPEVGPTPEQSVAQPSPTNTVAQAPATAGASADIRSEMDTTDARRGGTYNEKEVSTLPLGAATLTRTFDELGLLLPGVAPPPQTQGSVAGPGVGPGVGSAGQFSVNGLRSRANNFTVDGSDNNDEDIGVRRQGFLALVPQPIESIKEFQMITLLAPAQYGRNFGAQVNAVSKSGTSRTHGTAYGLFNSSQLNSLNFFDTTNGNGTSALRSDPSSGKKPVFLDGKPLTTRNESGGKDSLTLGQGGFLLGGPLAEDHGPEHPPNMFYFFSLEGHLLNATQEQSFAVPTVDQRGFLGTGATGFCILPSNCNDPNSIPVFPTRLEGDAIFSLFPFPNNTSGIYGANTLTQVLPASGQSKLASGKFDGNFKINGKQQFFTARYNFTDDWRDVPATGGAIFSTLRPRVRTQNFSTFLNSELSGADSGKSIFNQLRLSYGRTRLVFDEVRNPSLLPSALVKNTPFLLNRRYILNDTLPGDTSVSYTTFGTTELGFGPFSDPRFAFAGAVGPLGQVAISGFSPVGVDVFNFPQRRVNNTYQLADTVTIRTGDHSFALGADTRRTELNSELPRNARPLALFGGPPTQFLGGTLRGSDFAAAGSPTGFFITLATDSSAIHLRYYQLDFFGQDEWRVRPNLSISYGARYEYNTVPHETSNRIEKTFNAPELSLLPDLSTFIAGRTEIFDPDRNNIAPRVGIAYSKDFFENKSTVIRGGYGLFYDQILGAVVSQSRNVYPTFLTLNTAGGAVAGNPAAVRSFTLFNPAFNASSSFCASLNGICYVAQGTINRLNAPFNSVVPFNRDNRAPAGFGITLPARDLPTPMAHQYSVTVEQQLSRNTAVSAAYVGTIGRHLLRPTTPNLGPNVILLPQTLFVITDPNDPNFLSPTLRGTVRAPGNAPRRPFPTAGSVNIFETNARSRYDALQLQLRGRLRLAASTQYQVSYTFSRSNDNASDVFDLAGSPALPQDSVTFAGEYGPSNFDARHRIAYNYVIDLPRLKSHVAQAVLGNIQVAGTGQFQTGQPFTVNSIFDVNLDGNLTDRLNSTNGIVQTGDRSQPLSLTVNPATLLAPVGQDGQVPRNSFRAGNLFLNNVAVVKTIPVSESAKIVLRAEFFNIFNRANFGIPVRFLEFPSFGKATDTVTPGRRIQFGLKLIF